MGMTIGGERLVKKSQFEKEDIQLQIQKSHRRAKHRNVPPNFWRNQSCLLFHSCHNGKGPCCKDINAGSPIVW